MSAHDFDRHDLTDHDMLIQIHQVVVTGEQDKRVRSLERSRSWSLGFAAAVGALSGWLSAHLGIGK